MTYNIYLVDSHCHLNYDRLSERIDDIVSRATDAGVGIMQTICTRMNEVSQIRDIAYKYENVFYSVGIHPLNVHGAPIVDAQQLISMADNDPKVTGFGETGLDYYRTNDSEIISMQQKSFEQHIIASQQTAIPVIIHTREAEDDTLSIINKQMKVRQFAGVLHCFTGSYEFAAKCVDMGLFVSASGIITFKNAEAVRDVFIKLPLESILIETDAPFLAPVPYRSKTNEPSYIVEVVKTIASIRKISYEAVATATTENFLRLFKRVKLIS